MFPFSGCSTRAEDTTTQRSKEIVVAFYKLGLQELKPKEAFARYMTPDFTEHAADSAGGSIFRVKDGLIAEHWDLVQQPREHPINPHSVF